MQTTGTDQAVLANVIAVVSVEACVPPEKITAETKLEDLGMDSLDFVALMNALDVPQTRWSGIQTVADLVKALND